MNSHKPYVENFGYGKSPLIHPKAPAHHDYLKNHAFAKEIMNDDF